MRDSRDNTSENTSKARCEMKPPSNLTALRKALKQALRCARGTYYANCVSVEGTPYRLKLERVGRRSHYSLVRMADHSPVYPGSTRADNFIREAAYFLVFRLMPANLLSQYALDGWPPAKNELQWRLHYPTLSQYTRAIALAFANPHQIVFQRPKRLPADRHPS
jgi:hypothetical protein